MNFYFGQNMTSSLISVLMICQIRIFCDVREKTVICLQENSFKTPYNILNIIFVQNETSDCLKYRKLLKDQKGEEHFLSIANQKST